IIYCVPLKGVFHPGVWPMVCGLVAWSEIGAPHRPQKRLPGTRGWPQEVQTGLVIKSESTAVDCSRPKRELRPLKRGGGVPDSRSGLKMGNSATFSFLAHPLSRTRTLQKSQEFFFESSFCLRGVLGLFL